ncbi:hypothetical protein FA95DRAFT_1674562 [Auriscalpium vulgare]|uniref:Uncharacterized protein n=1 Tax=Auriscalpium vulgare TaxID=40419 RepID=A0ACB8SAK3_9AGAM|nr:hypothetical protein FA95DRAFT_1674562 [Auriscalpium vulgare]
MSHCKLYIVVYPAAPGRRSHWALFATYDPSAPLHSAAGTLLQVEGNPGAGFYHDILRGYRLADEPRSHTEYALAEFDSAHLAVPSTAAPASAAADAADPADALERIAFGIAPPERSLRSAGEWTAKPRKIVVEDCQTWVGRYMRALVEKGVVPQEGLDKLQVIPQTRAL